MKSIDNKILDKIKKARRGTLFYTEDFLSFGTHKTTQKIWFFKSKTSIFENN